MKKNTWIIVGGLVIGVVGLIFWGNSLQSSQPLTFFSDTDVACLPNGHQQLAAHIHPTLTITVDGEEEGIPANIGVNQTCLSETHTHDATGTLHIETTRQERLDVLTLQSFFDVWGRPVEREGFDLTITANGREYESITDFKLQDHMNIELAYTPTPQEENLEE